MTTPKAFTASREQIRDALDSLTTVDRDERARADLANRMEIVQAIGQPKILEELRLLSAASAADDMDRATDRTLAYVTALARGMEIGRVLGQSEVLRDLLGEDL